MARPTARTRPAPVAEVRDLDGLLSLGADQLAELYAAAQVPQLDQVKGALRGRMLAWPSLSPGGLPAGLLRAMAASDRFPWRGKSFMPDDDARGAGVNRVVSERWELYRFNTFIGPSRADGFDALQLDYDRPDNPFFIRAIKDELRELSPGLFLGQAWLEIGARAPRLVLYFGLGRG